jgi:isopentenyldiphosphate isomerase
VRKISDYSYPNETKEETIGKCYVVIPKSYIVKTNNEVQDYKWASLEEFESLDHIPGLEEEALQSLYSQQKAIKTQKV